MSTLYLCADASFLSGAARILDMGGVFDVYNTAEDADALALYSDWRSVGDALTAELEAFGTLHEKR